MCFVKPLLRLTKERLNPHLSFLIGFLVCCGLVIRCYAVKILLKKTAAKGAPVVALGTFGL